MKSLIGLIPRRALCAALALIPLGLGAAPLEHGAELPVLKLSDQFDKPVVIGPATQVLVLTAEKPASDLVIKVLGSKPKGALESSGLVYVADISAMPVVITRMFALPKLRERPFRWHWHVRRLLWPTCRAVPASWPSSISRAAASRRFAMPRPKPSCCRPWRPGPEAVQPTEIP